MSLTELDARFAKQTGWIRRPEVSVVRITGEDRQKYLHTITTNAILAAPFGSHQSSAILNPKGKALCTFQIHVSPDALDVQMATRDEATFLDLLSRYKMRSRVAWEKSKASVLTLIGETRSIPEGAEITLDDPARRRTDFIALTEVPKIDGFEMDFALFERHRVWFGIPEFGKDLGSDDLLLEAPYYLDSISLNKGCYPGQEVVARLTSRGNNLARKLVAVDIEGSDAQHTVEGARLHKVVDVGHITSAAWIKNRWRGLAMIHRSAFEPGTVLEGPKNAFTAKVLPSDL